MKSRTVLLVWLVGILVLGVAAPRASAQEWTPASSTVAPQAHPVGTTPVRPPEAPQERVFSPGSMAPEAVNVKVEVTISYQVGTQPPVKRTAVLTVADRGNGFLRVGNQIAVPSTSFTPAPPAKADGGPAPAPSGPVTAFNYRNVGLNLDVRSLEVSGNHAKMQLNVEFSAIDEKTADTGPSSPARPPSFPTFSQSLSLVCESGKPVVVAQSSDYVDSLERKQSVEVKATILR